jgi:aspartyl aminopeptidase
MLTTHLQLAVGNGDLNGVATATINIGGANIEMHSMTETTAGH